MSISIGTWEWETLGSHFLPKCHQLEGPQMPGKNWIGCFPLRSIFDGSEFEESAVDMENLHSGASISSNVNRILSRTSTYHRFVKNPSQVSTDHMPTNWWYTSWIIMIPMPLVVIYQCTQRCSIALPPRPRRAARRAATPRPGVRGSAGTMPSRWGCPEEEQLEAVVVDYLPKI